MPKIHELKTVPPYFQHVLDGTKTFEFRKNDRGFSAGDYLFLREYLPDEKVYTGREINVKVVYVLEKFAGIENGYCILGVDQYFL